MDEFAKRKLNYPSNIILNDVCKLNPEPKIVPFISGDLKRVLGVLLQKVKWQSTPAPLSAPASASPE